MKEFSFVPEFVAQTGLMSVSNFTSAGMCADMVNKEGEV